MADFIIESWNELKSDTAVTSIVFISDLHFDYTEGEICFANSDHVKQQFFSYIEEHYRKSIICILGDSYNHYKKTIGFLRELEARKIQGFYVLGEHDYWNNGEKSFQEIKDIYQQATKNHEYFHVLMTGKCYNAGEVCFIGDTGWTSFRQDGEEVDFDLFLDRPESWRVKAYSPETVLQMHKEWIHYANSVIAMEKKVMVLTHFPMLSLHTAPEKCWMSSETELLIEDHCWYLFGHTHNRKFKQGNFAAAQRGVWNMSDTFFTNKERMMKDIEEVDVEIQQYCGNDFGMLIKAQKLHNPCNAQYFDLQAKDMAAFYSPVTIHNPGTELELVKEIKGRGFKRCSSNRKVFAAIANEPDKYLQTVKEKINCIQENSYAGYDYSNGFSESVIYGIHTAIGSLEYILNSGDFSNPQIFVTAAVITGYIYNDMPYELELMRPIDYYDVVRFYLMFLTMKRYGIGIDEVCSIRRSRKHSVIAGNMELPLPEVNGQCMDSKELTTALKNTPLLQDIRIEENC